MAAALCDDGEMESVRPLGEFGEMEYLVFFGIH
jgi:hypothetical protein